VQRQRGDYEEAEEEDGNEGVSTQEVDALQQ